jgi:hypothetical protein
LENQIIRACRKSFFKISLEKLKLYDFETEERDKWCEAEVENLPQQQYQR